MHKRNNLSNNSITSLFRRASTAVNNERLVGVIDEGTNDIRFSIYTTPEFKEIVSRRVEIQVISPKEGWFEQNPIEIIESIRKCCREAIQQLSELGYQKSDLVTIGITNQRETTIAWDCYTGKPLYNAIVWNDIRTYKSVNNILLKLPNKSKDYVKDITGLPVSPYFSALKICWMRDNVPEVRKAIRDNTCKVGTMDSWIVYNLTKGALHITDVTNASRTLLMNIETLNWDPMLLKMFAIDRKMLPTIYSCSEIYGQILDEDCVLKGVTISGILGNQQASLIGQMCLKPGHTKSTYRSGCFVLCNTGESPVISGHGLLTTVAYKLGPKVPAIYALEGSVAVAGHALHWLKKNVRILPDITSIEKFAEKVPSTGDVYFVPAFTGLYAPYWRKDARGILCGLTQFTTKNHIVRAALESICYQMRDILECMILDSGCNLKKLHCDGELSQSNLLMQLQADVGGISVFRSQLQDTTTFGAAMCAAQAAGIELCIFEPNKRYYDNFHYDTFLPTTTPNERHMRYSKWKKAVERSMGWKVSEISEILTSRRNGILASIPPSIFLMTSFAMLIHGAKQMAIKSLL